MPDLSFPIIPDNGGQLFVVWSFSTSGADPYPFSHPFTRMYTSISMYDKAFPSSGILFSGK